jgi:hypothetical protein
MVSYTKAWQKAKFFKIVRKGRSEEQKAEGVRS